MTRWGIAVLAGISMVTVLACGYAAIVPFDAGTMQFAVSVNEAKQAAKDWAGNQLLVLDLTGVDTPEPGSSSPAEFILFTPDRAQCFRVCTNTGQVRRWYNKSLRDAYLSHLRGGLDRSQWLPTAELSATVNTFLSTRYTGFAQYNMTTTNPEDSCAAYAETLTNGVQNRYRAARCVIDQWTGDVCSYSAPSGVNAPISTQFTVQSAQAVQDGLDHVLNIDWYVADDEEENGHNVKFAAAFVSANLGVAVLPDKIGNAVLVWQIGVVSHVDNSEYSYSDYVTDLRTGADMDDVICWAVDIDANTGTVRRCDQDDPDIYSPPSVATPTFSPAAGTYTGTQSVTISCSESGAAIRYTTDGTKPTPTSTLYSGPVSVSTSQTLKARAYKTGFRSSLVGTAEYVIE